MALLLKNNKSYCKKNTNVWLNRKSRLTSRYATIAAVNGITYRLLPTCKHTDEVAYTSLDTQTGDQQCSMDCTVTFPP